MRIRNKLGLSGEISEMPLHTGLVGPRKIGIKYLNVGIMYASLGII